MARHNLTEQQKLTYAGMWLIKKMDIGPKQGGFDVEVPLEGEYKFAEQIIDKLYFDKYIEIDPKKAKYILTERGISYIGRIINEAEDLIETYEDYETYEMVEELEERNLDVFRARFLWGLYDGEFDDIIEFQEKRGFQHIEESWSAFIMSDDFFDNLILDIYDEN